MPPDGSVGELSPQARTMQRTRPTQLRSRKLLARMKILLEGYCRLSVIELAPSVNRIVLSSTQKPVTAIAVPFRLTEKLKSRFANVPVRRLTPAEPSISSSPARFPLVLPLSVPALSKL